MKLPNAAAQERAKAALTNQHLPSSSARSAPPTAPRAAMVNQRQAYAQVAAANVPQQQQHYAVQPPQQHAQRGGYHPASTSAPSAPPTANPAPPPSAPTPTPQSFQTAPYEPQLPAKWCWICNQIGQHRSRLCRTPFCKKFEPKSNGIGFPGQANLCSMYNMVPGCSNPTCSFVHACSVCGEIDTHGGVACQPLSTYLPGY